MNFKLCILAFFIAPFKFILITSSIWGQPYNVKFNRLTIDQGLSQNNITSIVQDHYGFMWFGTLDGLNKYDGYAFTVYKHVPGDTFSLSSSIISALYEDKEGKLWIGTMAKGLNRLDLKTEQISHFRHDPEHFNSLSDDRVRAIYEDRSGNLWIGTRDGGLNLFEKDKNVFVHFNHDVENPHSISDNHIRTIFEDRQGHLWIGTFAGGLNLLHKNSRGKINPDSIKFTKFLSGKHNEKRRESSHIETIFQDRSGQLWIGTYGAGLAKLLYLESSNLPSNSIDFITDENISFKFYQHDGDDPSSISSNNIEVIYEDYTATLWIGTNNGGLNRFDPETENFTHYKNDPNDPQSLSYDNLDIIYEDRSKNLWIGTWGGGLNKIDRKPQKFQHYKRKPGQPNSLTQNYVRAIAEDPLGYLWVGTSGGGLDRMDRGTGKVWHYRKESKKPHSLSSDDIRCIYFDYKGTLWVGTYGGGLNRLISPNIAELGNQNESLQFKHYFHDPEDPKSLSNNFVWCIHPGTENKIWIGTSSGLDRFDPDTETFKHYKPYPDAQAKYSDNIVRCIFQDNKGRIWIGTYHGLHMLDPEQEKFVTYTHDPSNPASLSHSSVISIAEDASGTLWIGTLGGGLNSFDPQTGTAIHFLESDGLPNTFIHALMFDNSGNLWIATNQGISKLNLTSSAPKLFRNFDLNDGLQSNEFNVGAFFKSKSGEMFFGGVNGFNSFFPERIQDNPYVPPVILTSFKIFNQETRFDSAIHVIKEIELSYKENFFSFEFAALDFTLPEKNHFAYMMEGFDTDWVDLGNRNYVSYTNLDPGEYVLRVKASNNDGVWNEEGLSLRIRITPPVWQTWWFRLIMLILLVGSLATIVHSRIQKLSQEKEAQEQFSRRLITMQEDERKRVASELHDSLGHDLIIINNLISQQIQQLSSSRKLRKQLQELSQVILQSLNQVREIAYNLHPHHLERLGLNKAIESMMKNVSNLAKTELSWHLDELEGLFSKEVEINIFRIVQELISNAIRHAEAPSVKLNIERKAKRIIITIEDTGKGLPPDYSQKGFGWANLVERIKIIQGKIKVYSKPQQGTKIQIKVPIKRQVNHGNQSHYRG